MKPALFSLPVGLLSDIALWLVLLVLAGGGLYYGIVVQPRQAGELITLHFHDANEITRGAAVRMMGTDIGHVDRIALNGDHVDITVFRYADVPPIPSGSLFTVQFTGLVGSKSIEIVPPRVPRPTRRGKPVYLVEEPIRMKDNMHYQMDILQDLQKGAENIADFFGKKKPVEELQVNIRQMQAWTSESQGFLAESDRQIHDIRLESNAALGDAAASMNDLVPRTEYAIAATNPESARRQFYAALENVRLLNRVLGTQPVETAGESAQLADRLTRVNLATGQLGKQLRAGRKAIEDLPVAQALDGLSTAQSGFSAFIGRLDGAFGEEQLPALQQMHRSIQGFNTQVRQFSQHLDEKAAELEAEEAE